MLFAAALVMLDLVMKSFIINAMQISERITVFGDLLTIGRIQNVRMALGDGIHTAIDIIKVLLLLFFLFLAFRSLKTSVHKWYKYATVLIASGWIGYYADILLLANAENAYASLSYLNISLIPFCVDISCIMSAAGWILLLMALVTRSGDLKLLLLNKDQKRSAVALNIK